MLASWKRIPFFVNIAVVFIVIVVEFFIFIVSTTKTTTDISSVIDSPFQRFSLHPPLVSPLHHLLHHLQTIHCFE